MRCVNDEVPGAIHQITIVRISHVRSLVLKLDALVVMAPWKRAGGGRALDAPAVIAPWKRTGGG